MRRGPSLRALRRNAPKGVTVHVVKLPVMAYWTLTLDEEWQNYCAELEKNDREVIEQSEAPDVNGDIVCTRTTRLTARENPIPKSIRAITGVGDTLSYDSVCTEERTQISHSPPRSESSLIAGMCGSH